jgi:tetratricopeptide (TPR) repeat protein
MALRPNPMFRLFPWVAALAVATAAGGALAQEEELGAGVAAYNSGHYESAAGEFYHVVESGQDVVNRQKAEYYLAQSFYKMKLYQPAFQYYGLIVKQGARHRYYFKAVAGLVNVAEALHDGAIIPSVLNRSYGSDFERLPEKTLNKVNYLVGMLSYRANKVDEAQEFLSAVPKKSSYFARARYLYGLSLVQKSPKDAVKLFKEVMALPVDASKYYDIDNVRELTRLALARTYYGMGLYDNSVTWFESVPRFSNYWDQALFENGWAEFQDGKAGKGLGSLEALHAPQFAGAFAPESWVLKATIYYFNCLYPETKGAISGLRRIYLPYNEQIKTVLTGDHDFDYYAKLIQKPEGELPLAVVNYLIGNQRVLGFKEYLDELATEKTRVDEISAWKESGLGPEVSQLIDTQEQILVKLTGKFVQGRLKYAQKTIEGFDSQAEIILFETLKAEKELIEHGVDSSAKLASQELWRAKVPDPTWDYWAFEGEFWIDEIGYYEYTLKNGCALRQESR